MGRPQGSQNEDYDEKRQAILERLSGRIVSISERASFRDLAASAGVSVPTLRHYFRDREGLLAAWLEWKGGLGAPHLELVKKPGPDFESSVLDLLSYIVNGLSFGRVIELHSVGLAEGLTNPMLGPAYLQSILEPTLAAAEERLQAHIGKGQMRPVDVRSAALSLVSPVLLAVLHQRDLGGKAVRCLDVDEFVAAHGAAFVKAYESGD